MKINFVFSLCILMTVCSACGTQKAQLTNEQSSINQVSNVTRTPEHVESTLTNENGVFEQIDSDQKTLVPEIAEAEVHKLPIECIGTFEDFAYVVVDDYHDYVNYGTIYPGYPWELITKIPDSDTVNGLIHSKYQNSENGIWVARMDKEGYYYDGQSHDYLVYYPDHESYIVIPSKIGETGVWVRNLLFSPDGEIWGSTVWNPMGESAMKEVPILSKFNGATNKFEFDENSRKVPVIQGDINFSDWPEILISDDGVLWIFIPHEGLYRYDSESGETSKKVDIPERSLYDWVYGKDGNIYYLLRPKDSDEEAIIYKYDPKLNSSILFATIDIGSYGGGYILMDCLNRIWLGTISLIDTNGKQIILHPDYEKDLEKRYLPEAEYWAEPSLLMETSNGNLWFAKRRFIDKGAAWFNPVTSESCWFTTFAGSVYEDMNHQLWFLAGDRLYMYSLDK